MASKATPTPPCPHLPLPSASGQQQIGTALKPELSLWVADFLQFLPTSNSTKRSNSTQSENFSRFSQLFTPLWVTCGLQGLAEVFIKNSIQRQGTILILALEQCYFMALCFKLLFGSRELPYNYLSPILSLEELLQLLELRSCSVAWRGFLGIEVWECGDAKSVQYVPVSLLYVVRGYG